MPSVAVPLPPTATVTVRAVESEVVAVAVTVTVFLLSFSATLVGLADRVTGSLSLSVRVSVAPLTVRPVEVPEIPMVSSPSTEVSFVGVSVKVPEALLLLALMVMSKSETAV